MDNHEAKFILQARRAGGQDADDPRMAEALEQARRDPELGRWLEEEQAFDRAVGERVRSVPVPAGLREAIVAGVKVTPEPRWWRQPSTWAVAAVLTVLGVVLFFVPAANHEAFAADYFDNLKQLDHREPEIKSLCQWLAENEGHCNILIPKRLRSLPTIGCRIASWEGRKFSLICFKAADVDLRPEIHLMIFDAGELPGLPPVTSPQIRRRGDWTIASWTQSGRSYILARVGDERSVRNLL